MSPKRILLCLVACIAVASSHAHAQTGSLVTPNTVAAAEEKASKPLVEMLVDFARYAKWSGDRASGVFKLCFVGYTPTPAELLAAKQSARRPFQSVEVIEISNPAAARGCHVLWLAANARPAPRHWVSALPQPDTLTFSDHADFAVDGGVVAVWRDQSDWRFEINIESLQRSGVVLSASVLRLSRRVR